MFSLQGVDLSNIIKDLALSSGDNHEVTTIVSKLKELATQKQSDDEAILKELEALIVSYYSKKIMLFNYVVI